MDSYIQIYVDSKTVSEKFLNCRSSPSFGRVEGDFWLVMSDGGGTFCLHFLNLHEIWIQESIDLNSIRFGQCCNIG